MVGIQRPRCRGARQQADIPKAAPSVSGGGGTMSMGATLGASRCIEQANSSIHAGLEALFDPPRPTTSLYQEV